MLRSLWNNILASEDEGLGDQGDGVQGLEITSMGSRNVLTMIGDREANGWEIIDRSQHDRETRHQEFRSNDAAVGGNCDSRESGSGDQGEIYQ